MNLYFYVSWQAQGIWSFRRPTCGETLKSNVGIQHYRPISWQAWDKSRNRNVGRVQKKESNILVLPNLHRYDFHFFVELSPKTDRTVGFQGYDLRFRVGITSILAEGAVPGNRQTQWNWLFHSQSAARQTVSCRGRLNIWWTSNVVLNGTMQVDNKTLPTVMQGRGCKITLPPAAHAANPL